MGAVGLFGPAALILRAISGGDEDSNAWIILLLVFPFAFMFGGWLAAYERPPTPLRHGAAAAALGFVIVFLIVLPFRIADDRLTLPGVVFGLIMIEIAAVFGLLGGLLAARGVRVR